MARRAWACPGSQLNLSMSNLSVSLEPSFTNETQSLVFPNRCGCGCQGKCLSSSHTCNKGNLCGSKRATVPSRISESGRYNRRAGWYIQRVLICKNSVPAENGRYKRLDDISVDDLTGFHCISEHIAFKGSWFLSLKTPRNSETLK